MLDRTLEGLADRAMKILASGLSDVRDQRAKLLELEIAGREVTLRMGGVSYRLVRREEVGA